MTRKTVALILLVALLITMLCTPAYAQSDISVSINFSPVVFDVAPKIISDRSMVPMRKIFETLGASVDWNDITGEITAEKDGTIIKLVVNSTSANVNGDALTLDTPPIIIDSRTLVPLRFISEALGCTVLWNAESKNVDIYSVSPETWEQLLRMNDVFDKSFVDWVADMYDTDSGGFYYAMSGRDTEGFYADIESTSQALSIMDTSKLKPRDMSYLDFLPDDFCTKITNYIQSRQNPDDGYFYDPQFGTDVAAAKRERNLVQGEVMCQRFGVKPLYLLPLERINVQSTQTADVSSLPDYLQTAEKFDTWMRALPWTSSPYAAAHQLGMQQETATGLGYLPMIIDFIKSIQNPMTGLWGDSLSYESLNASLKISPYFTMDTEPYPRVDKMIDSLVYILGSAQAPPQTVSETWNPVTLINFARLSYANKFTKEIKQKIDNNMPMIIKWAVDALEVFKKPDGGFSYMRQKSTPNSQNSLVSLGLAEGDMNASSLAMNLREKCYAVAGLPVPDMFDNEMREYFIGRLKNAQSIVKKPLDPLVYNEDFENLTTSTLTERSISLITSTEKSVSVVQDPNSKEKNNVLKFSFAADDSKPTRVLVNVSASKENLKSISFQAKVMVESGYTGALMCNNFQNFSKGSATQWIVKAEDDVFSLSSRYTASGLGTNFASELDTDEWYTMKIEYCPDGTDNTKINFYIDDDLVGTTNKYSGFGSREPVNVIDILEFTSFTGSEGVVYIDDMKLFVE